MNIVALLDEQAAQHGERIAIYHGNASITYSQLAMESCRGSNFLHYLGLKSGDMVLVFVPMSIDLYIILLSLWRQGMTAMFLDPGSGRKKIRDCCLRTRPQGFIGVSWAQLIRLFHPALREIPVAITTGRFPWGTSWRKRKRFSAENQPLNCPPETPALITFTSGSTGVPKGTVRSHGFLLAQKEVLQDTLCLQEGSRDLATLPVFALINLACGVTTVIPSVSLKKPGNVATASIIADIERHQPQTAVASPAFFERLLTDRHSDRLACLQAIYTGGAPVFPTFMKKIARVNSVAEITAVYGSTEAEPIAELHFKEIVHEDFAAMAGGRGLLAGRVIDRIDCRIIKDNWGTPLASMSAEEFQALFKNTGEAGEIVVSGSHVLKGYLGGEGDKENKFMVDKSHWHRTGDLGYFDEKGRLWLLGRCSAKIVDAKGTIFPFAIETAAMQREGIKRAALTAADGGRILAIETTNDQLQIEEILRPLTEKFNIDRLIFMKIPVDPRHNAKVNYTALQKNIRCKIPFK